MASSEAESPAGSADANLSPAAMDAKARREARKARILSSGTDRLARITKTGRGGEAELLYSDSPKPSRPSSSSELQGPDEGRLREDEDLMLKRARAAMQGSVLPDAEDDPGEVDISQPNTGSAFMAGQQEGMPQDLQGMMKMMQSAMLGGQPGQAPVQGDANAQQPFPFAFPPTGSAASPLQQPQSSTSSLLDSLFNLLRIGVFIGFGIALVYGALGGHAPAQRSVSEDEGAVGETFAHMTTVHRWARLAYERPAHWEARYFGVESFGLPVHGIPVFWLFVTLEIALQSSRIMLQRSRPTPPGFLLKASAYIPNAHVRLLIRTVASYLPLLDAFVNDLAIVVFTIGCTIMFAAWKVGLDPILADGTPAFDAGLQTGGRGWGSGGASMGEKMMDMNSPVMGNVPTAQGAL